MRILNFAALAPAAASTLYRETFSTGWEDRWVRSAWKGADSMGEITHSAGKWFADEEDDKGLRTEDDHRFYAISSAINPFSNEGKTLYIQFQVKHEQNIECGGAYLKFGPKLDDLKDFKDDTEYNIMFGPDMCGHAKRTHLIFTYKGKNLLKKVDLPYKQLDNLTHLYLLVLRPNNTARVEIDGEMVYDGSLEEDWDFLLPREIADEEDKKPEDWVDAPMMDDTTDSKPEDWVEESQMDDEDAKRPDEWDDEEDGEWERPKKDNPDYKGKWYPKRIDNPDYKGAWKQKMLANPDFVADDEMYKFENFGYVALDVWQVRGGTIFDNVILTFVREEVDELATKWTRLNEAEVTQKRDEELRQSAEAEEARKNAKEETPEEEGDDDLDEDEEI